MSRRPQIYPVGHVMNPRVLVIPRGKTQVPLLPSEQHPKWAAKA